MTGIFLALLTALMLAIQAPAQIGPEENIRKILNAISEEMSEIDRLLMESSRKNASAGMSRAVDRIKELMQQSQTTQDKVIDDLDKLIEQIESMQQSGQPKPGSGQRQSQENKPGQTPKDQQRSTRTQTSSPEIVKQQDPQNSQPKPQPDRPQPDTLDQGRNIATGEKQDDPTAKAEREVSSARWGNLPKYVRFMMNRGGLPEVPEKYRRLLEAYQKQTHRRRDR